MRQTPAEAFRGYLGLTRAEARVLAVLWESGGKASSSFTISEHSGVAERSVKVLIHRIRDAMNPGAIEAAVFYGRLQQKRHSGWFLTRIGLRECEEAIMEEGKYADSSVPLER